MEHKGDLGQQRDLQVWQYQHYVEIRTQNGVWFEFNADNWINLINLFGIALDVENKKYKCRHCPYYEKELLLKKKYCEQFTIDLNSSRESVNKKTQEVCSQDNQIQELKRKTQLQAQEILNLNKEIRVFDQSIEIASLERDELQKKIESVTHQLEEMNLQIIKEQERGEIKRNKYKKNTKKLEDKIFVLNENNQKQQKQNSEEIKELTFNLKRNIAVQRKFREKSEKALELLLKDLNHYMNSSDSSIVSDTDSCPPSSEDEK